MEVFFFLSPTREAENGVGANTQNFHLPNRNGLHVSQREIHKLPAAATNMF